MACRAISVDECVALRRSRQIAISPPANSIPQPFPEVPLRLWRLGRITRVSLHDLDGQCYALVADIHLWSCHQLGNVRFALAAERTSQLSSPKHVLRLRRGSACYLSIWSNSCRLTGRPGAQVRGLAGLCVGCTHRAPSPLLAPLRYADGRSPAAAGPSFQGEP